MFHNNSLGNTNQVWIHWSSLTLISAHQGTHITKCLHTELPWPWAPAFRAYAVGFFFFLLNGNCFRFTRELHKLPSLPSNNYLLHQCIRKTLYENGSMLSISGLVRSRAKGLVKTFLKYFPGMKLSCLSSFFLSAKRNRLHQCLCIFLFVP